jgi:hypothetical protein
MIFIFNALCFLQLSLLKAATGVDVTDVTVEEVDEGSVFIAFTVVLSSA